RHIIQNIYKYINNIPYTENDEMEISQFLREKLRKLSDRKYMMEYIRNIYDTSLIKNYIKEYKK
ncbi:MAG TPA: hypothetical protein PL076_02380, partial [Bacillota bacterium]|nr:hypothetical protein [Bacillota bacterium]